MIRYQLKRIQENWAQRSTCKCREKIYLILVLNKPTEGNS